MLNNDFRALFLMYSDLIFALNNSWEIEYLIPEF